jgi:chromate reductase
MRQVTLVTASDGKNLVLAQKFDAALKEMGAQVHLVNLVALDLPLYSSKAPHKGADLLAPLQPALAVQAYIFIGPEFNGGIPPVLTNFLAWASTSSKDWRQHFNAKRAAIASHSGGDGALFLAALRLQLSYIGLTVVGRQLSVNDRKEADPKSIADICQQLLA